jgi:hypothetical protein
MTLPATSWVKEMIEFWYRIEIEYATPILKPRLTIPSPDPMNLLQVLSPFLPADRRIHQGSRWHGIVLFC